ncbi:MAG: hypothetical protein WA790_19085 [Sulfitobacter sp.]
MEREPNLVISGTSKPITEDGIRFKIEICKLEGDTQWSLEVVTEDNTSIVWDDLFDNDEVAFDTAVNTIRSEGARAFQDGGDNVVPFKR